MEKKWKKINKTEAEKIKGNERTNTDLEDKDRKNENIFKVYMQRFSKGNQWRKNTYRKKNKEIRERTEKIKKEQRKKEKTQKKM